MSNTKSAESTLSEPIFNRQALVRLILPLLGCPLPLSARSRCR